MQYNLIVLKGQIIEKLLGYIDAQFCSETVTDTTIKRLNIDLIKLVICTFIYTEN